MKQLIFTLSLLTFLNCKDNKSQESETHPDALEHHDETQHDHQLESESNVYTNAWRDEIEMDNGEKWQSDLTTNEGVKKLQQTFNAQNTTTLEEYHKLASQLNDDKNYLVKNCTMQGPAHDNLHTWLHPLIEKIAALSETETIDDASKIKNSIDVNIHSYYDYFK